MPRRRKLPEDFVPKKWVDYYDSGSSYDDVPSKVARLESPGSSPASSVTATSLPVASSTASTSSPRSSYRYRLSKSCDATRTSSTATSAGGNSPSTAPSPGGTTPATAPSTGGTTPATAPSPGGTTPATAPSPGGTSSATAPTGAGSASQSRPRSPAGSFHGSIHDEWEDIESDIPTEVIEYFEIYELLTKAWLLVELTHRVSKTASNAFWKLSLIHI